MQKFRKKEATVDDLTTLNVYSWLLIEDDQKELKRITDEIYKGAGYKAQKRKLNLTAAAKKKGKKGKTEDSDDDDLQRLIA